MSTIIGYYFDSPLEWDELGAVIDRVLGCRLVPDAHTHARRYGRFCSLEMSLGRHGLEDDLGIAFSEYPYELQLRVASPDLDLLDLAIALAGLLPALLWSRGRIDRGILVHDLQRMLARYATVDGVFVELNSGVAPAPPEYFRQILAAFERD